MKKTKHITARISDHQFIKLMEYSNQKGLSVSAAINTIIDEFFKGESLETKIQNLQTKLESSPGTGITLAIIEDLQEIKKEAAFTKDILCTIAKFSNPKVYKEACKIQGFEI